MEKLGLALRLGLGLRLRLKLRRRQKSSHAVLSLLATWAFIVFLTFNSLQLNAAFDTGSMDTCDLRNSEALNINSFDNCTQKQLDHYYLKLNTGVRLPNGDFNGKVQLASISTLKNFLKSIGHEFEEYFLERLWKGKSFSRDNNNEVILFNRIIKNYPMFPAHVYIGKSLFDANHASIIIDYKNNQDIEGYRPSIDWLVNKNGLAIRDEIRKVNKSLYLGRAYVKDKFLLNFVLESTL